MGYIRIAKVYEKLKRAEEQYLPVIMTAASGYGKSAAVAYYYRRKKTMVLRCRDGVFSEMPEMHSFRGSVIVIEDLQWLCDEAGIRYLRTLLEDTGRQVVMLTRGGVPKYLMAESLQYGFVQIQEQDFVFGEAEVRAFFKDRGIGISPEEAAAVCKASEGYATALHFYVLHMEHGEHYSEELREMVWQDVFHLWDGAVYEQWPEVFRRFALAVCPYETFTIPMAERMTGDSNLAEVIEYCRDKTGQLRYVSEGVYSLRHEIRRYLLWKRSIVYSGEQELANLHLAADHYESVGDSARALFYYSRAKDIQAVKRILIRNASGDPEDRRFAESREYYFALPEEEVLDSPGLMSALSLLYDMALQPDRSEEWYRALFDFYKDEKNDSTKRREAQARLAYLDMGLPHRGAKRLTEMIEKASPLIPGDAEVLPEISVTGNMPSLLNGRLDYCEWTKEEAQFALLLEQPMKKLLGRYAMGLMPLAQAECGFEKGTMSSYGVLERCNEGYEAAVHGGRIEMCFVAVAVQVRQHVSDGQLPAAKRIYDTFLEKAVSVKAEGLMPNLHAFGVCLSLYGGYGESAEAYIAEVPDVRNTFCTSDRYRQMAKLRCLIAAERLEEAFDLAVFLSGYYRTYERHYMWLENELLKAVILYRTGNEKWMEIFCGVLRQAEEYHLLRVIALEGAAVLPMFNRLRESGMPEGAVKVFAEQVFSECVRTASVYPDYMQYHPKETVVLTGREQQVLSLLCAGYSTDEICSRLGISYDGLKKHNRNIYRKLGAGDRAEAERNAARLGLVHRSANGILTDND